ncbi:MAG: transcriptional regulator [Desulfurococcales archaeon ex4484_217_2]|nr:MAG: transcriptional regulator [Desulfurococcales archaeon ex4484_217_2]
MRNHILGAPARLGIMVYLLAKNKAFFTELLNVLKMTPGNLDSHLRKLRKAGYVDIVRVIGYDRPRVVVKITDKGRYETINYLSVLRRILEKYYVKPIS